jgi:DNA primase
MNSTGQVLARVSEYCCAKLHKDEAALNYLTDDRGLSDDTIRRFEIGLFPQDLRELFDLADPKSLREAGVIKNASKSVFKTWDLVMPIRDVCGNHIAMAGRVRMSEEERDHKGIPKYINSVYKKSQHLYGLNFAKRSILEKGVAYVVEGLFDVIMPHQKGLDNFVGICGKQLSTRHIALLARYADKIVLMLDNEQDAQECAQRTVQKKQYDGISLAAYNPFPQGIKDVDQFLRNCSVGELVANLEKREDYGSIRPLWD